MKKTQKRIRIILVFLILTLATVVYANPEEGLETITKSEAFEKWEELSKTERENTLQPTFFDIGIKSSVKRSIYNTLLKADATLENHTI